MDERMTRAWAEVSLGALAHNCQALRAALPADCGLMGVVKANAYGHGAAATARVLHQQGAGYLAVACPEEALELRAAGESLPILVLGASAPQYAPLLAERSITQAVECLEKGRALSRALRPGQRLKIHIKLDTGMGRLGFAAGDRAALSDALATMALPGLEAEGVFTHFAVSDEPETQDDYTRGQFARFRAAVETLETGYGRRFPLRHCANSGAVLFYRQAGFALDMARPGLLLYGLYPTQAQGGLKLRPAMALKARVSAVTRHARGDTISYGRSWTATRDCRLAVLPVGYADGLHRTLSGKLSVRLGGGLAPQIGRICMDMCMVDVTDLPEVAVGDVATVFGGDGPSANQLAALAGTIPYELLCAVSPRVPRIYTE